MVDFGSGHNPRKGFKTCEITTSPFLDYRYDGNRIIGLEECSVDVFNVRNVIHHIKDLGSMFDCLKRHLKPGGRLEVIDCTREAFKANVFLDKVWYRYVNKTDYYISPIYREYIELLIDKGFRLDSYYIENEKEYSLLTKMYNGKD